MDQVLKKSQNSSPLDTVLGQMNPSVPTSEQSKYLLPNISINIILQNLMRNSFFLLVFSK